MMRVAECRVIFDLALLPRLPDDVPQIQQSTESRSVRFMVRAKYNFRRFTDEFELSTINEHSGALEHSSSASKTQDL